ncbi:DUF928 domain-containing protein [Microcoleus sp. FACHB-68]|uniref:DUF928 domain-containing protein n=1 Tax=Microcoleus sp. FACHB-68 TaxID=2692826 RepID=UPI0011C7FA46|nr:DUF928 domain-containing protein [Microcoleus sp. FACHB-68]MBD1938755.1 DUF928 domain-containing protein [Microcoleus sp. FACHB-68]
MNQLNSIQFTLLKTFLVLLSLPALPLQAAIPQPHPSVTAIKRNVLATSVGDIVDEIRPKRRGKGSRGNEGEICVFAPIKLVNFDANQEESQETPKIWTDRPLFLWQGGTPKQIELFVEGSTESLWSRDIPEEATGLLYDGEPLQPGQTYEWRLTAPFPIKQPAFQIMEPQKRDRISAELTQLQEQLQGASEETIALEKANYFAKQELWADALQELYSVSNPSPALTAAIKQIQSQNFCPKNEPNDSAS